VKQRIPGSKVASTFFSVPVHFISFGDLAANKGPLALAVICKTRSRIRRNQKLELLNQHQPIVEPAIVCGFTRIRLTVAAHTSSSAFTPANSRNSRLECISSSAIAHCGWCTASGATAPATAAPTQSRLGHFSMAAPAFHSNLPRPIRARGVRISRISPVASLESATGPLTISISMQIEPVAMS
jgi:hypothetical protein